MFEQTFRNIDDVLRKEAGCATELDYTEQTSWMLFLKYLDDLERERAMEAELVGKSYDFLLDEKYRWSSWAAPKDENGEFDHNDALTGDDLIEFVDLKLFPYLQGFQRASRRTPTPSNTRSAKSSARSATSSPAATACATPSSWSTRSASARRRKSTSSRTCTRPRSATWVTPGAMGASTTPRAR
ncbi:MAG: type I restriction-modification system subunit M N-terminal domain-containing protein [Xanthomonadales bacterium]|nr:type I restriction-modification system subunit M N-terminal domain-containing protein [Xanthomonadales bacterium]